MDDDVLRTVHNVSDAISSVESALKPLFGTNWDAQVGRLDPIDASRFHLTVAYAVNALFFIYIKACGLDEDEYKVNADLKQPIRQQQCTCWRNCLAKTMKLNQKDRVPKKLERLPHNHEQAASGKKPSSPSQMLREKDRCSYD
mmetsp:Transcript_10053/g.16501  ORF Transcript_10053/g.16501 Transcript_10053/m.16501 type:complete len:143 (+) Transcript_10053:40-468(+)